jgi:hypothetical protein
MVETVGIKYANNNICVVESDEQVNLELCTQRAIFLVFSRSFLTEGQNANSHCLVRVYVKKKVPSSSSLFLESPVNFSFLEGAAPRLPSLMADEVDYEALPSNAGLGVSPLLGSASVHSFLCFSLRSVCLLVDL